MRRLNVRPAAGMSLLQTNFGSSALKTPSPGKLVGRGVLSSALVTERSLVLPRSSVPMSSVAFGQAGSLPPASAELDEPMPEEDTERSDVPPSVGLVLMLLGAAGLLACCMVAGVKAESASVGALAFLVALIAVAVETAAVAFLLIFISQTFGIDYGPVWQALVRLGGCIAFINGFTFSLALFLYLSLGLAGPLGVLMAFSTISVVSFVVFQAQFQLCTFEAMITVFAIEFCAFTMGAGLGLMLMRQLMVSG